MKQINKVIYGLIIITITITISTFVTLQFIDSSIKYNDFCKNETEYSKDSLEYKRYKDMCSDGSLYYFNSLFILTMIIFSSILIFLIVNTITNKKT